MEWLILIGDFLGLLSVILTIITALLQITESRYIRKLIKALKKEESNNDK